MGRHGSQHSRQAISRAKGAELLGLLGTAAQSQAGRIGKAARGAAQPGNEIHLGRDAGFLGLRLTRVNHGAECRRVQAASGEGGVKGLGNLMPAGLFAGQRFLQRIAPPLQADQRGHGVARGFAGAGQFMVEGDQGENGLAPLRPRKKRGQETVRVMGAGKGRNGGKAHTG